MAEAEATKKPRKVVRLNGLLGIFTTLQANIPGVDADVLAAQVKINNYFLTEKEIEHAIGKGDVKEEIAEEFVQFLQDVDAIKKTKTQSSSSGITKGIDSEERAREVANDPTNEEDIKEIIRIMTEMKKLRDEVRPLIDDNAVVSIALKNSKKKEEEKKKKEKRKRGRRKKEKREEENTEFEGESLPEDEL
jgi:vacuolar-type H+-ATPase subunit F/Vma7